MITAVIGAYYKKNCLKIIIKISFILLFIISFNSSLLAKTGSQTGLDIPRFVALKSSEVNLRVGPSINYPIKLKYIIKNLPVEIIEEYDVWRKIKDHENNQGWLHKSLIKGDRFILINLEKEKNKKVYNRPDGTIIGLIERNNIVKLKKCLVDWCYIVKNDLEGWISKKNIWGVYSKEIYKISFIQPVINQYWKILDYKFSDK